MTEFINERIQVQSKSEALKLHLIVKCFQKGISLSNAELDSLIELYEVGYSPEFYSNCVEKGYFKSEQTVRNAVANMKILGILSAPKRGQRVIDPEYLPNTKADKLMINFLVGNMR